MRRRTALFALGLLLVASIASAQINYAALKTELQTDPQSLGYAASVSSGNDVQTASVINQVRAGITIRRNDITNTEILEAVAVSDFIGTITAAQLAYFQALCLVPGVRLQLDNGSTTAVRTNLIAMFTVGSGTLTRLGNLATRSGSRAEQLFGTGIVVQAADVARALR